MSWNNNLQKRCPERQFPKIWPERPLTNKKLARTTIYKEKRLYRTTIYKKNCPEGKFAEKVVQNTNLQEVVWNDYLRKTSCQEQQPAQFANRNGSRTTRCKYVVWNKLLQKMNWKYNLQKVVWKTKYRICKENMTCHN